MSDEEWQAVASTMDDDDWTDVAESEFVDFVEGRHSVAFVFEHDELGLHGFKLDTVSGVLGPCAFDREESDSPDGTPDDSQQE